MTLSLSKKHLISLLFVILCGIPAYSNTTSKIKGFVYESNYKLPIDRANIKLYFLPEGGKLDSLITTSNKNGFFSFPDIQSENVVIEVSHLNYGTKKQTIQLSRGENAIIFFLDKKETELEAATVKAEIPLIKQIKDSSIYNARAINSLPEDKLKDILAQFPGFSINNNIISINGEEVKKTYINGVLIFGNNYENALEGIKAEDVVSVIVYDEQNSIDRHRGKKNSTKDKVINILTGTEILNLRQGEISLAGGMDESKQYRYEAKADFSFDSERKNVSVNANAANFKYEPLGDYNEYESINLYLSRNWKNRDFGNTVFFNYRYSHNYNSLFTHSITDYFGTSEINGFRQIDSIANKQSQKQHNFTLNTDLLDTPLKSFKLNLVASISEGNNDYLHSSNSYKNERGGGNTNSYFINSCLSWENNDAVKWRPGISFLFDLTNDSELSWALDNSPESLIQKDLNIEAQGQNISTTLKAYLNSTLVNSEKYTSDINFQYVSSYSHRSNNKQSLDNWGVETAILDLANSFDNENRSIENTLEFQYDYADHKGLSINALIYLKNSIVSSKERIPSDYQLRKNFTAPGISFYLKKPKHTLSIKTELNCPTLKQLSNRIVNTNPMILYGGNPNLQASYLIQFRYNLTLAPTSFSWQLSGDCTLKPIINDRILFSEDTVLSEWDGYKASAGTQLYTYSNSSTPSFQLKSNLNYDKRFNAQKLSIKSSLVNSFSLSPQSIYERYINILSYTNALRLSLVYNPNKKFKSTFRPSITYLYSEEKDNSIISESLIFGAKINTTWAINKNWKWTSSYLTTYHNYRKGLGQNHNNHIINTSIVGSFLKNKALKIGLHGIDLLNSTSLYTSVISASQMKQEWRPTYGRFFIISLSLSLSK